MNDADDDKYDDDEGYNDDDVDFESDGDMNYKVIFNTNIKQRKQREEDKKSYLEHT